MPSVTMIEANTAFNSKLVQTQVKLAGLGHSYSIPYHSNNESSLLAFQRQHFIKNEIPSLQQMGRSVSISSELKSPDEAFFRNPRISRDNSDIQQNCRVTQTSPFISSAGYLIENPVKNITPREMLRAPVQRRPQSIVINAPHMRKPEYRIYELNKLLQQRPVISDNFWWNAFVTEFFEDNASLTITFSLDGEPKIYSIGRALIPRYFKSIFDGGVIDLYYNMRNSQESLHATSITLYSDQCDIITHHGQPFSTKVCTEGRLILEFTYEAVRIKSWYFAIRSHGELIPRSLLGMLSQENQCMLDQLSRNITRQGITTSTLNYLRMCEILEPMQKLMARQKEHGLCPRDCLNITINQTINMTTTHQNKPESPKQTKKTRKRKSSNCTVRNNINKRQTAQLNYSLDSSGTEDDKYIKSLFE